MTDLAEPTRQELEAAHCWEADDLVPKRPETTAYRRRMRLHQARWREAGGHPIGTQPIVPKAGQEVRPVGNRLPLDYAKSTGATFLTQAANDAATNRFSAAAKEPQQSLDAQRTWADLLWPTAFCFNLLGDLAADLALARTAVAAWFPDAPGTVSEVRFEHSPGRLDTDYLGNLCAFSAAFVLDLGDGERGIIGLKVAYADWNKRQPPKSERLPRYIAVSERSAVFGPDWLPAVNGTELVHVWLEHMLVHSMLQHPSGAWRWGRYVVVHPTGNVDFADTCTAYRSLLDDPSTFASMTVEDLLGGGVLPSATVTAFRDRYLP